MEEQFNKIIGLIRQTGDKCIVLNQLGEAYVVMALKDYENLILGRSEVRDLTEEELLDKMNRDIAIWRASQEQESEKDLEETLAEQFNPVRQPVCLDEPSVRQAEPLTDNETSVAEVLADKDRYYFEPLE
ncbi:MAG: hypothetical protein V1684_01050 [bacterium]